MIYKHSYLKIAMMSILLVFTTIPSSVLANQSINDPFIDEKNIDYYAVIIGKSTHTCNQECELGDVSAQEVYQSLLNGVNWNQNNIRLLFNENVTPEKIKFTLLDWLDPLESDEDIIFFYYNGDLSKSSLIQTITEKSDSGINESKNFSDETEIQEHQLDMWFDELESNQIHMILDTDYASYMTELRQWGRTILAATGMIFPKKDDAVHINQKSVVAHYTSKGLNGYADENLDGYIDASELFSYIKSASHQFFVNKYWFSLKNPFGRFQSPNIINRVLGDHQMTALSFGWKQLAEDGFGSHSNYATRGMEIFNGDLYISTPHNLY
jgi:hypothetical protein